MEHYYMIWCARINDTVFTFKKNTNVTQADVGFFNERGDFEAVDVFNTNKDCTYEEFVESCVNYCESVMNVEGVTKSHDFQNDMVESD